MIKNFEKLFKKNYFRKTKKTIELFFWFSKEKSVLPKIPYRMIVYVYVEKINKNKLINKNKNKVIYK